MSGHPSGVGLWRMWPRVDTVPLVIECTAPGHTAFAAWLAASAWVPVEVSFCDLCFELVAERADEPIAAPTQKKPRRMVGAERGART